MNLLKSSEHPHIMLEEKVVALTPVKVYLHKDIRGFTLILQICFQDIFTCCNLSLAPTSRHIHTSNRGKKGPRTKNSGSKLRECTADFIRDEQFNFEVVKKCIQACDSIHLTSFAYDFHLRHFATYMLDPMAPYPTFNLEDSISALVRFFPYPPGHARNQLIQECFMIPLFNKVSDPADFFAYLANDASKYGIGKSTRPQSTPMIYIASSENGESFGSRTILSDNDSADPSMYVFVAFLAKDASAEKKRRSDSLSDDAHHIPLHFLEDDEMDTDGLMLQCYVMRVDRNNISPFDQPHFTKYKTHDMECEERCSKSQSCTSRHHSTSCLWNRGSAVLQDVVLNEGKNLLSKVVAKASVHYQRDQVWKRITISPSPPEMREEEYRVFRSLMFRRPLQMVDTALSDLVNVGMSDLGAELGAPLHSYLCRVYHQQLTQLSFGHYRHLFILNPKDKDMMIQVVLHLADSPVRPGYDEALTSICEEECGHNQFKVYVCRRELVPSLKGAVASVAEQEMVTHFINHVCHFMWEEMVNWLAVDEK